MRIDIGPFRYSVQLVHGMIRHDDQDCYGLCDNLAQRILISDVPNESQRLSVFFHELMHAWWYHFGIDPADEEAVADLVGVAMTQFMQQAAHALRGRGMSLRAAPMTGAPSPPHVQAPDEMSTDDDTQTAGSLRGPGQQDQMQSESGAPLGRIGPPTQTRRDGPWIIRFFSPVAG